MLRETLTRENDGPAYRPCADVLDGRRNFLFRGSLSSLVFAFDTEGLAGFLVAKNYVCASPCSPDAPAYVDFCLDLKANLCSLLCDLVS